MINSVYNYYAAQYGTESILNMIPIQRPSSKAPLADYKKSTVRLLLIRLIFLTRH